MGDCARLIAALLGLLGFALLAVALFVAVRVEQAHRALRRPPPEPPRCDRLHASDALEGLLARERAACGEGLEAEDLPSFRADLDRPIVEVKSWVDDEELSNPILRGR